MEADLLREKLKGGFSSDDAVKILSGITELVNNKASHDLGREMVIRSLAVKNQFPSGLHVLLETLVQSVGLLPYLADSPVRSFEDQLLLEAHRIPVEGDVRVFHTLQLQIFNELRAGRNVVLSATTSVGKSAIVDAIIASGDHRHLAIIVPTIALIDETRRRISGLFGSQFKIVTHPTQDSSPDQPTIFVLTQERALSRPDLKNVTFFVIDEFYKLEIRDEDDDRAVDLNLCFHRLASSGAQFYLIGPHVDAVIGLPAKHEYLFVPSLFSTVALDITQFHLPRHGGLREQKLVELCNELTTPTLVYCQSPGTARKAAEALLQALSTSTSAKTSAAVEWLEHEFPEDWVVTRALRAGIGIHHGNMPRALQQYMVKAFETGAITHLICTSTIIEGVNTVAENVIVFDKRINNGGMDYFTFRNIAGRAGRMRRYFVGKVFVLEEQPQSENFVVELAVGTQTETAPLSLLLDLEEADLLPSAKERVTATRSESPLSIETLRANRHVSIDAQHEIYFAIKRDLHFYEDMLSWTGMPRSHQFLGVCDLIVRHLDGTLLKGYGIFSGAGLQAAINRIQMEPRYRNVIENFVAHRRPEQSVSDAVELGLRFMRKYVCFTFPRHLMAISNIQKEIFEAVGRKPGDYSFFAARSENLFMEAGLFALDEYGIPPETSRRLARGQSGFETLESALRFVSSPNLNTQGLLDFELNLVADVRQSLPLFV